MFIVLQSPGDTMVVDSVRGHRATHERLTAFLSSPQVSAEIEAGARCPAFSDSKTLRTFRMVKTTGLILTQHLPGAVLQVSGRPDLLSRYVETFQFNPGADGDHRHPEQRFLGEIAPRSDMIIVEVVDDLDDPDAWLPCPQ